MVLSNVGVMPCRFLYLTPNYCLIVCSYYKVLSIFLPAQNPARPLAREQLIISKAKNKTVFVKEQLLHRGIISLNWPVFCQKSWL